jgi:hypothetical protein
MRSVTPNIINFCVRHITKKKIEDPAAKWKFDILLVESYYTFFFTETIDAEEHFCVILNLLTIISLYIVPSWRICMSDYCCVIHCKTYYLNEHLRVTFSWIMMWNLSIQQTAVINRYLIYKIISFVHRNVIHLYHNWIIRNELSINDWSRLALIWSLA